MEATSMKRLCEFIAFFLFCTMLAMPGSSADPYPQKPAHPDTADKHMAKKKMDPLNEIKIGMTRASVEAILSIDGGLGSPFIGERFIVPSTHDKAGRVMKVNLDFKPAGITNGAYSEMPGWKRPRPTKDDVLMKISEPYWELPFCD